MQPVNDRRMIWKTLSLKSLLALLSGVLSLVAAEGIARWTDPLLSLPPPSAPREIDPYEPNPYILPFAPFISLHIPGARYSAIRRSYQVRYEINARGFRGPEVNARPAPGKRRLIVVGDSVAEGAGVPFESAFPSLLDRRLKRRGWEVVNLGVQGASPIYYAANLSRYFSVEPQAGLLLIFENDLYDDRIREPNFLKLPRLAPEGFLQLGLKPPAQTWRLPNLLRRALRRSDGSRLQDIVVANSSVSWSAREEQELRSYRSASQGSEHLVAPLVFDQNWELSRRYLDLVEDSFRQKNVPLLIASLSMSALERRDHRFTEHALNLEQRVQLWCRRKGLPYLCLTELVSQIVAQDPSAGRLSFPDDPHPNARVHQIFASVLQPWLIQELGIESIRPGSFPAAGKNGSEEGSSSLRRGVRGPDTPALG